MNEKQYHLPEFHRLPHTPSSHCSHETLLQVRTAKLEAAVSLGRCLRLVMAIFILAIGLSWFFTIQATRATELVTVDVQDGVEAQSSQCIAGLLLELLQHQARVVWGWLKGGIEGSWTSSWRRWAT